MIFMNELSQIPLGTTESASRGGSEMISPEERSALLRELLPPETAAAVEEDLRSIPAGKCAPLTLAALLIVIFGCWFFFPGDRFPGRVTEHLLAAENEADGEAGRILSEARRLHAAGRPDAARALLSPSFRTLAESGSPGEIEANGAVLEQYWLWSSDNPRRMELEARRILSRAPDSMVARIYLAESMLPFASLTELKNIPVRELRNQTGNFQEILLLLDPLTTAARLPEAARARVLLQLVRANAALWARYGFRDDPGEPGFDNRERALALCRRMPDDGKLLQWRRDILSTIYERPWYFWDYQFVEGEMIFYRDLEKRIDLLEQKLRSAR